VSTETGITCRELVELVTGYLEAQLSPEDARRFEGHLEICEPCVVYVEQMRQTIALAGQIDEGALDGPTREAMLAAFRDWRRG
jgi:anti-sigma factor RsiW